MKKLMFLLIALMVIGSIFAAPLNEGFEGTTFPPTGWSVHNGGSTNTWLRYTSGAYAGSACASIAYNSSLAHDDWLITPQLVPSAENFTFSFWAKNGSTSYIDKFNVKLSTTDNAIGSFTNVLASDVGPGTTYTEYTYDLSAYIGSYVYVAIQAISLDELRLYVDAVTGPEIYVAPTPVISLNPNITTWDFGTLMVGQTATKQFTITNVGGGSLDYSVGTTGTQYSISVAPTDTELANGESSTFTVQYTAPATAGGPYAGSVVITDNRAVTTITLSGSSILYGASYATSTADDDIGQFILGSFANPETAPTPLTANETSIETFTDYTALGPIAVNQGSAVPVSITQINSGSFYTCYAKVFIDYNQNGVFDVATEVAFEGSTGTANPLTGIINVPLSATLGETRLRVVLQEGGTTTSVLPFGTYSWGETEDYTVSILEPIAGAPGAVTLVNPSNGAVIPIASYNFTWTPGEGGTPTGYDFYLASESSEDVTNDYLYAKYELTETSFNPAALEYFEFDYSTRYQWTVVPYNTESGPAATPGFFDTQAAPVVISTFPWEEGFEGETFPPTDWAVVNVDGGGTTWVENVSATYVHSGTKSAGHLFSTSSPDQDGWMITPAVAVPAELNMVISFWNYNVWPTYMIYNGLLVNTTNDPADPNWVELWSPETVAAAWSNQVVNISAYGGQTVYFAFNYQGYDADNWFVDDISIYELTVDLIPPTITTLPHLNTPREDLDYLIVADIVDDATWNNAIGGANLYYTTDAGVNWSAAIPMTLDTAPTYYAEIPAQPLGTTVGYYIEAWDILDNTATSLEFGFNVADPTWMWYDQGGTTYLGYTTYIFGPTVIYENPFFGTGTPMNLLATDGSSYYGNTANLHIYSYDGTDMIDLIGAVPVTFGAQTQETFDLSSYNIQIDTQFFVVAYEDIAAGNYILFDGTYDYGTTFVKIDGELYTLSSPGTWAIGAYVQTGVAPLEAPVVTIGADGTLSWDAVAGAAAYNVYSSDDPYGTFTLQTSTTETSWLDPNFGEAKMFYHVTTSDEAPLRTMTLGKKQAQRVAPLRAKTTQADANLLAPWMK